VSVVAITKAIGTIVTQAYLALPSLMMNVVPTQRAKLRSVCRPNIGQIVLMLPVRTKYPQAHEISALEITADGRWSTSRKACKTFPEFLYHEPATLVPVSIVVNEERLEHYREGYQ
jgi:hypothetical protein